jgi:addiction module HigA family antidote
MTEIAVRRRSALPPTHPGELLREELLPAMGLSVSEAARRLRVSRQTLHALLAERTAVTPEMALRLGKFCGNGPAIWLRLQQEFDLRRAERRLRTELRAIVAPSRGARTRPTSVPARGTRRAV